jgi:hypothetical protein
MIYLFTYSNRSQSISTQLIRGQAVASHSKVQSEDAIPQEFCRRLTKSYAVKWATLY